MKRAMRTEVQRTFFGQEGKVVFLSELFFFLFFFGGGLDEWDVKASADKKKENKPECSRNRLRQRCGGETVKMTPFKSASLSEGTEATFASCRSRHVNLAIRPRSAAKRGIKSNSLKW